VLRIGGIDTRRAAPKFAAVTFHRWWRRTAQPRSAGKMREPVVLWTDSFSNGMNPEVARAAVDVLTDAGYSVIVPDHIVCCGLTWITTGQLRGARRRLLQLLDVLEPYASEGVPIVGLEPSCVGVLRSDLIDLLPDDPRAAIVARATKTLAEMLTSKAGTADEWRPPDLSGLRIIVQPHCHHHSVMGFSVDQRLLEGSGADLQILSGCCGLAGNFGMERGHYDISVGVANSSLLPALRSASHTTLVLADGFSCRTQIDHLAGLPAVSLAQLLADRTREAESTE